jgi:spore maturation protein CgeB
MRSFEIPGVGGIMVAPKTTEHNMYFQDGRTAFLYTNVKDCARIVKDLLSLTEEDALKLRNNAHTDSISLGYTYADRSRQALKEIQKLYE